MGDSRLSEPARSVIEGDPVYCSVVNYWEIGLKLGRSGFDFSLPSDWAKQLPQAMRRIGVEELGIEAKHCGIIERLPPHHQDPFDRMLIAQAVSKGLSIITRDRAFRDYDVAVVW